jgi:SAM-dependent methyltransferase
MPTITIDSTNHKTYLCSVGEFLATDKSPFCPEGHRHPYTAIYNLLFAPLKNKEISFAEIGVWRSASMKLWSSFFPKGKIYGFDYNNEFLHKCNSYNLPNVTVSHMDVKNEESIRNGFMIPDTKYDVIIDDSSHDFDDQIRIIKTTYDLVKPGGYLIIEDIYEKDDENTFINAISDILGEFSFYTFLKASHDNTWTDGLNNNKMLVLIKN